MATGDLTCTVIGTYRTAALAATGVTGQNCGAATNATETATFHIVPAAGGQNFIVFKIARAA